MRRPSDLPRHRAGRRPSGRTVLIVLGVLFLVVVVFGRAVARFYVDYLWHDGLGRADVFWGVIRAKATLFAVFLALFAALAGVNLLIADKLAPSRFPANVHPYVERFHELFGHRLRLVRYVVAGFLALLVALPTTSQWQSWLLFRNSRSFGMSDAQFGADVGFYVFELPFLGFVLDWLFVAMVLVLMITAARPRAQRRRRVRLADAVGAPGHQGSHRRAARRARRPQGRRLLGHPLRDHQRAARLRAGGDVRRRQRPAPGADAAGADRPAHRRRSTCPRCAAARGACR